MSISEDIRRIELELIDVETRLKNTSMLERSYSALEARREILVNQLDYLKRQVSAVPTAPVVSRSPKGPTQSEIVKAKVDELRKADHDKSMEDIFDEVAEAIGKTPEAVKASYYRKSKK